MAAMIVMGAIAAGTSIYGAHKASSAAKEAAKTQAGSSQAALDQQRAAAQQALQQVQGLYGQALGTTSGLYGQALGAQAPLYGQALQIAQQQAAQGQGGLAPYAQTGGQGLTALSSLLGLGGGAIGEGLENTPGYQFRLKEGQKALERSAASRGSLLTGGTAKGLTRYAQDVASQEYAQRVAQLAGLANLGYGAAGQQAGLGMQYAGLAGNLFTNQAGQIGNILTGQAGQVGNLLGNQAALTGNILTGNASNVSDLLTQQGNAQAAGQVGSANAWNAGITNAANIAQQYYLARLLYGGGTPAA